MKVLVIHLIAIYNILPMNDPSISTLPSKEPAEFAGRIQVFKITISMH